MHWEFALQHDLRWLARWGLTYYGCCEPLDRKIDILRRIPNLRKISVSPWCNTAGMVAKVGRDYVMSRKPSPAILAEDQWHPERARQDLCAFLDAARGCHVELIMKDISTVRYQPQRLWEWARIAAEVVEEYAARPSGCRHGDPWGRRLGPIRVLRIAQTESENGIGQFPPVALGRMNADKNCPVAVAFHITDIRYHCGQIHRCNHPIQTSSIV